MKIQPSDGEAVKEAPLDPLRRVFRPIEKRTANGTLIFRTLDGQVYQRGQDGSIRRSGPKVKGKSGQRLRRFMRRQQRSTQMATDPRPDQSSDGPKYPNPGQSPARPAEGGAGTGTPNDPTKSGNQPPPQQPR